jgi:hypothetical protein
MAIDLKDYFDQAPGPFDTPLANLVGTLALLGGEIAVGAGEIIVIRNAEGDCLMMNNRRGQVKSARLAEVVTILTQRGNHEQT